MTEEIRELAGRYEQVSYLLSDPAVLADAAKLKALMREHKSLSMILEAEKEEAAATEALARAKAELSDLRQSGDDELIALAEEELAHAEEALHMAQERLALLLVPKDPDDDKSVIMEIRAGTGGEEAALFAGDLYRMYSMYAASVGLRLSLADSNETELGGYKYISFLLEGEGAFARFKFESGTHRVQRVPVTDSQGKLQTSAVTVAVLPEAEEVDLKILPGDIEIGTCKSSGAGGQHINKTESAVRVTHKPSGIVVECRSERSQLQNKEQALRILRSKLYEIACREQQQKIADTRRAQVGSGDRSAKIRTYNFPQNRVTDHRIGFTLYSLDAFMDGAMQPMIDALASAEAAEKRKNKETQV